jgi:peptide chain release factor 2
MKGWKPYTIEFQTLWCVFDIIGKEKEVTKLEAETAGADFWNDQTNAQKVMRQLDAKKAIVTKWRTIEKKVTDLKEIVSLASEEEDSSLKNDIQHEIEILENHLGELEVGLTLSSEYDARDAIVAIHAGAGGTESQDWAAMLLRMYLRWAERQHYQAEILDNSPGEETGIKSVTMEIKGEYAYGYLKSEHGVHRLVRLSPFDADHARHTSFALVEVLPEVKEQAEIQISPDDLKIDTFRSSGPGGQHMQKTSSAVRVTHIPSGLIVTCESQRSQLQNKESAIRVLHARLLELEFKKRETEKAKIKGKRIDAGWGNQIRSYVLHPYKMVKDHRTNCETSNTTNVLDGDLNDFIICYLRSKVGEEQ